MLRGVLHPVLDRTLTPKAVEAYADQFRGMTHYPVALAVLEETREQLIARINAQLTLAQREFLLSLKRMQPEWDLLGLPGVELLPGPQWKLYNLRRMDPAKRKVAEERLRQTLGF